MPIDDVARAYCLQRGIPLDQVVESDLDCTYCKTITVDLAQVTPMVALPHSADHACPLSEQAGMPVDMVVIGTCTNGRISDFEAVDTVLQSCTGPFRTETLVIPASRTIYREMLARGYAARLLERGAMILPPSCGPCCGSSPGVPRDGLRVVSTANRNFLGRMGNASADIYLTSPAVAAATALRGCLTDPKELMEHVSV